MALNPNAQIIQSLYEALDRNDFVQAESYFAPNAEFKLMGPDMTKSGIKDIHAALKEWHKSFPDQKTEITQTIAQGDWVALETMFRGTHKGALDGPAGILAPTNRKVEVPAAEIFKFQGDKIVSWHCYLQGDMLMNQLGVGQNKAAAA